MPVQGVDPDLKRGKLEPTLSIIIPVYREGGGINDLISHLAQLEGAEASEIILVDGDAGSTFRLIHPGARSHVRSTLSPQGRGRQMNRGARMSRAGYLLFLHADARLPRNGIAEIIRALESGCVQAGAFALGIDSKSPALRVIARIATLRSRWTRIPFGDQAHFFSREGFRSLGGYPEWPLMEDVELMRRVRSRGWPIALLRERVMTSPRRWEKEGILACTLRNWVLQILFRLGISPKKLARWYPPSDTENLVRKPMGGPPRVASGSGSP